MIRFSTAPFLKSSSKIPLGPSIWFLFTVVLGAPAESFLQFQGAMQPHPVAVQGPWFEGWYYRLTDPSQKLSLAIIGTAAYRDTLPQPGYKAILFQHPKENRLMSFEKFPTAQITLHSPPHDFQWKEDAKNWLSRSEVQLEARDTEKDTQIKIQMLRTSQSPWSQYSWWGPSGWAHLISLLPLQWFVDNVGGQGTYRVELERNGEFEVFEGSGFLHQEKNWGEAFPLSWIWVQGHSATGRSSLALAGGRTTLGGIPKTTYLFGYRAPHLHVDLNLALDAATFFDLKSAPCRGKLIFQGQNKFHRVSLRAAAPLESFTSVAIPTEKGYQKNGGIESFIAEVEIEIHLKPQTPFSKEKILVKETLPLSALEFGGEAMKCETLNAER